MRKMVLFCGGFLPDENFQKFLQTCGYSDVDIIASCYQVGNINFDERIIAYVEEHSNFVPYYHKDAIVLKGAPTSIRRIGFLGTAVLLNVDTERTWTITYDHNDDYPIIKYVKVISSYGQIRLINERVSDNDSSVDRS